MPTKLGQTFQTWTNDTASGGRKAVTPLGRLKLAKPLVSTGKVLAYVKRSKAVGGLIFNPGDEKRSLAIAKFLLE